MINLVPYREDCFKFYSKVVAMKYRKKDDPTYNSRLIALEDQIEGIFKKYSHLVNESDLKSITPFGFKGQQKADLLSLYRYKSIVLQELLVLLTTRGDRKFNTCQMCTVEPVGSFDHIVPKEEFPEHAVNPINLFPSCLTCNDKKGSRWLVSGERAFLNLYYDILPHAQYLKIEFKSYPIPIYSIDGASLDSDFHSLVKSHYEKLGLFRRFRENSNEIIDPIVTDAKIIVPKIGIVEFRKTVEESTSELQKIYGLNYWKSLLKLAVVRHDDFESLLI